MGDRGDATKGSSPVPLTSRTGVSRVAEERRLDQSRRRVKHWNRWGPYPADRAWRTVREDYSRGPTPWEYFPHDHARSRVYRWNEDGLLGLCDRHQRISVALALWNGRDPFLKDRLFGLTNHEGSHGEDVKECYFYLDNTPTHSYMKGLYKYPHASFPYDELVTENERRSADDPEYELLDTGVFDAHRYFDVQVEHAKADAEDILIRVRVTNRGPDAARLDVLPTIWFRNVWGWSPGAPKPELRRGAGAVPTIELDDPTYGRRWLFCHGAASLLFTDNETNRERLFGSPNPTPYVKDAFHRLVVNGERAAVNPAERGTKAAAWYALDLAPGETSEIRLRFSDVRETPSSPFDDFFTTTFDARIRGRRRVLRARATGGDVRRCTECRPAGHRRTLRRRAESRMPDWVRSDAHALAGCRGAVRAAHAPVPATSRWDAPGVRRGGAVPARPTLA
jgi:hypothetical protein